MRDALEGPVSRERLKDLIGTLDFLRGNVSEPGWNTKAPPDEPDPFTSNLLTLESCSLVSETEWASSPDKYETILGDAVRNLRQLVEEELTR